MTLEKSNDFKVILVDKSRLKSYVSQDIVKNVHVSFFRGNSYDYVFSCHLIFNNFIIVVLLLISVRFFAVLLPDSTGCKNLLLDRSKALPLCSSHCYL